MFIKLKKLAFVLLTVGTALTSAGIVTETDAMAFVGIGMSGSSVLLVTGAHFYRECCLNDYREREQNMV